MITSFPPKKKINMDYYCKLFLWLTVLKFQDKYTQSTFSLPVSDQNGKAHWRYQQYQTAACQLCRDLHRHLLRQSVGRQVGPPLIQRHFRTVHCNAATNIYFINKNIGSD